jgi:hypothetical protein
MTGGATITSTATGKLVFDNVGASAFTITAPAATIGANVEVKADAAFLLTGANLTLTGNLTLTDKTAGAPGASFAIDGGRTLTAAGSAVTVGTNCNFTAPAPGTGILLLDVAAPNTLLTYTTPAASAVANLTVADNVALAGGVAGSNLTVGTALIHNGGDINIGTANLVAGGAYTRTAGTYTGTGYFVWNSAGAWNHGPAVTYPKLQVAAALNVGVTGMVTVADELYLNGFVLDHTTGGTSYLTIGDANGATVQVAGLGNLAVGAGENAPAFVGQTDYLFTGASSTPNINTWPTSQATNVTLNTAAAQIVTVGANRTILGDVTLTLGTLQWDSPVVVTLTDGKTILRRNSAALLDRNTNADATLGGFVVGNINLAYQQTVAADVIVTDIEYSIPTTVNNFSLLATTVVAAGNTTTVTINNGAGAVAGYARTIAGTLSMASVLNINRPTVWTLAQTIPAGSTVTSNAATTWTGGLTVAGTYVNAAGVTSSGAVTATGTFTNNGTFNAAGLSSTGTTNLAGASTLNLTGDATINNATVGVAPAVATINTPNNLIFTGTLTNAGLNLNFTGTNAQTVALGANRTINNLTLNKGNDQTVTFSGGNIILQGVAAPNGVLTLTRGVLVLTDPNVITLNPTVAGGFITALGYVRNPANATNLAHVKGKVGVAIPVNTLGRMEWPVGSDLKYRPAAITFTAGNATIAPTTVIVGHFDATPTGTKNFPVDGGVKFADPSKKLWIAGKAPYYWSFEATTSLGAAQKFDVELNGTNLQRPLENHNDLRIIRRFDGDVSVNGWFLEGAGNTYSNAMAEPQVGDTVLVVRNIGSLGSAIAQKAIFTIGVPSQRPVFTAVAPAAVTVAENATYTFDFNAADQDANASAMTFALAGAIPNNAVINATTGVFTFSPDYTQSANSPYTITVVASKVSDPTSTVEYTFTVTVTDVNRAPSFTATGAAVLTNQTVKAGTTLNFTYLAIDADADALTYTLTPAITPAFAGTATLTATGVLALSPVFADANKVFVVSVRAADTKGGTVTTTANVTVGYPVDKGDVDANGTVASADAAAILKHVVGLVMITGAQNLWAADVNNDNVIGAIDAAWVLYKFANGVFPSASLVASEVSAEFGKLSKVAKNEALVTGNQTGTSTFALPISISNAKQVQSIFAEFALSNDIEFKNIEANLPEGWMMQSKFENGVLKVAMAGISGLASGNIAVINVGISNVENTGEISGVLTINDNGIQSLEPLKLRAIPTEFGLGQNYPNPFNPTTSIKYQIAENANVSLTVYNMLGQQVKSLITGQQEAGYYTVNWDGTNEYGSKVASGIYIYRLQAGKYIQTLKMNLLK